MRKNWVALIGMGMSLLFLFILSYFEGIIRGWSSHSYQMVKADMYLTFVKAVLMPLAVVSLGINHVLGVIKFNWRYFSIFFIFGLILLFKLIVYIPMPTLWKIYFVKQSDFGGIIIGLGILLSMQTNKDPVVEK